jgi:hypothetical protein
VYASSLDRVALAPDTELFWRTITRPLQLLVSFEFLFALFVFGGTFKANPTFAWLFPIDPTLLCGAASMLVGLLILFRDGLYRPAVIPIALYFTLCSWVIVSIAWTSMHQFPAILWHLMRIVVLNGWVLVGACGIVAADRRRVTRFLVVIVIFALAAAIDWIVHAGALSRVGFLEDRSYQNTARMIASGFLVLFGVLIFGRFRWTEWSASAAGAVLFFYALLLTGARAPLVGLVLGVLLMLAMAARLANRQIRIRTGALPALLVALALIGFIVVLLQSGTETWTMRRLQNLFRFFANLDLATTGEAGDRSAGTRVEYLYAALRYWSSSWQAVVFGNGLLSFPQSFSGRYTAAHPHNIPLEILTEFGLVGFVIFAALVASLLMHMSFRVGAGESWPPVMMALCVGAIFFSLTSGDMINFFYFLVFGGLLPSIGMLQRSRRASFERAFE